MSIETMLLVIHTGLVRGAIPTTSQDSMSDSRKKKFTQEFFGVRNLGFLNSRSYCRFFYGKNIGSRIMLWFSPSLPTLMFGIFGFNATILKSNFEIRVLAISMVGLYV